MSSRVLFLAVSLVLVADPALGQTRTNQVGRTADSSVGEVGQRVSTAQAFSGSPLDRISNRIANRVQNRLRNRIDSTYNPQANATSPFVVAQDQVRNTRIGR